MSTVSHGLRKKRYATAKRNSVVVSALLAASLALIECDVTIAVKSWLASPAANDRTLKVSVSAPADRTATLLSPLATDGSQRPVLLLDYSAKCAGNACPKLTQ